MPTFTKDWSRSRIDGLIEDYSVIYSSTTATDDGEWFSCRGVESVSIEVDGGATATIRISGSNAASSPADTADEVTIADVTSDGFTTYEQHELPRFMKIHIHAYTSGTPEVRVKRRYSGNTA